MGTYLLAYKGGIPASEAERAASMAAWGAFVGGFGAAAVDAGNPFGEARTVDASRAVRDGATSGVNGYSIITAADLAAAAEVAKGCPALDHGGSVEVHEIFQVM